MLLFPNPQSPIPLLNIIDLNADLGESFGAWRMGDDAGVMPWITSANVACGFHAGDPAIMRRTVALCIEHGVAIGAHVSLPDLQGFGRREMKITPAEAYAQTLYQLGALHAFARAARTHLHHVKPHGALYNMAARDRELADAIAAAVREFNPTLILVGLAGSAMIDAGRNAGLAVQREGFCDRRYRVDGSLMPRSIAGAVIEEVDEAVAQAVSIATRGETAAEGGASVSIEADTLCVHGDANAAAFAECLHRALEKAQVRIAAAERPA
ncbi:MAG TPA: 5-oxoprolinase subunit PxpA [Rhodanobacteraceae bacterium]|nr:5-oxoprolinase subunit PxpA [Rhodanobacteraceae bacterium]